MFLKILSKYCHPNWSIGLIIVLLQVIMLNAQSITSIDHFQNGQNIRIVYQLQSIGPVQIEVVVSTNGGKSFSTPLQKVSGDVGKVTSSGEKEILWRVLEEVPELVGEEVVFKLKVSKEKKEGDTLVDSHSIGLRARIPYYPRGFLTVGGISRIFPLNKRNAIEGIISVGPWNGIAFTTLFERFYPLFKKSGFKWYWGAGITARPFVSGIVSDLSLGIGINLMAGITYKFKRIPLSISFDFKPTYEQAVLRRNERRLWKGEDYESALSVRYHFNKHKSNK